MSRQTTIPGFQPCRHPAIELVYSAGGDVVGEMCKTCMSVLAGRGTCAGCGAEGRITYTRPRDSARFCTKGCALKRREGEEGTPFLTFPIDGSLTQTWEATEELVARHAKAFPALNVHLEFRKALTWVEANPTRRKTATGMERFLFSWLNRAQDKTAVRAPKTDTGPFYCDFHRDDWKNENLTGPVYVEGCGNCREAKAKARKGGGEDDPNKIPWL